MYELQVRGGGGQAPPIAPMTHTLAKRTPREPIISVPANGLLDMQRLPVEVVAETDGSCVETSVPLGVGAVSQP